MSLIEKSDGRGVASDRRTGRRKTKLVRRSIAAEANVPVMPKIRPPRFPQRVFDIRDFGATPDSTNVSSVSKAFAKAISECAKSGGGRVLVPAGNWLTGPIHLRGNVELH